MQKSLFYEWVDKHFPNLVISIAETLNGRSLTNQIPFLFTDMLDNEYSPDSRWQSISGKYQNVAADVVALGAPTPLKKRDSLNSYVGDIPKISIMRSLNEVEMKKIEVMINQNRPEEEIIRRIFDDIPFVINGVDERIEDLFQSMLSTGIGKAVNNVGEAVRFDMGYTDYPYNHKGVAALWNAVNIAAGNAKPMDDIQNLLDQAERDGNSVINCYADNTALRAMFAAPQVRNYFGFQNNFAGDSASIPTLSFRQLQSLFADEWDINLVRVRRSTITEVNGARDEHKPWANGRMVFTCEDRVGALAYTGVAEESHQAEGVVYQKANDYTLVSKFSDQEPLVEYTKAQAMAVPVLKNVNRIYSLDPLTVQA